MQLSACNQRNILYISKIVSVHQLYISIDKLCNFYSIWTDIGVNLKDDNGGMSNCDFSVSNGNCYAFLLIIFHDQAQSIKMSNFGSSYTQFLLTCMPDWP